MSNTALPDYYSVCGNKIAKPQTGELDRKCHAGPLSGDSVVVKGEEKTRCRRSCYFMAGAGIIIILLVAVIVFLAVTRSAPNPVPTESVPHTRKGSQEALNSDDAPEALRCMEALKCNHAFLQQFQQPVVNHWMYCVSVLEKLACLEKCKDYCTWNQYIFVEYDIKATKYANQECSLTVSTKTTDLKWPTTQLTTPVSTVKSVVTSDERYDMRIDLTSGMVEGEDSALTWQSSMSGSGICSKQGVLKLQFGRPGTPNRKNKVRIDMYFENPQEYVFNIGDSPTNDGNGGDFATTSRDAEIQGRGSTFSIFGNDYHTPPGGVILTRRDVIKSRFTVIIANGEVKWNNYEDESSSMINTDTLFALNGQPDMEGGYPNYDIYFGMNRVIDSNSRHGTGLCNASVTWIQ